MVLPLIVTVSFAAKTQASAETPHKGKLLIYGKTLY